MLYTNIVIFFTFFLSNGAAAPNHEVQNTLIQMSMLVFFKSNQAITRTHIFIAPFPSSFNLLKF